jgi:Fe2+ transport system protein FeoA
VRIGTKVRMVQGGSPCLCELGQTRVSLRLDRRVQVLVLPAS